MLVIAYAMKRSYNITQAKSNVTGCPHSCPKIFTLAIACAMNRSYDVHKPKSSMTGCPRSFPKICTLATVRTMNRFIIMLHNNLHTLPNYAGGGTYFSSTTSQTRMFTRHDVLSWALWKGKCEHVTVPRNRWCIQVVCESTRSKL